MGETFPNAERSQRAEFVRELVERLYDGCSVTFSVPQHPGNIDLVDLVLLGLRERGCLTGYLDLSSIQSIDDFSDALSQTYVRLITDNIGSFEDVANLDKMDESEKIDWAVWLSERIAESLDKRLVVWFDEWQEIARMKDGDLLLKRLRGMFQLQTHVTYAFTGSRDPDLLKTLFADRHQPLYRFAVRVALNE